MTETIDDGSDRPTDQELRDLLDAERHRQFVEERRRRHGRGRQAEEALSFVDVLGALAAHRAVVSVRTTGRILPVAQVCEVGRDYVALRSAGAVTRLIPLARIASATPALPTSASAEPMSIERRTGSLDAHEPLDLAERLRELVGLRAHVRVAVGGTPLAGRLRRVGSDVVVLEHDDGTDQFVVLAALDEVVVMAC